MTYEVVTTEPFSERKLSSNKHEHDWMHSTGFISSISSRDKYQTQWFSSHNRIQCGWSGLRVIWFFEQVRDLRTWSDKPVRKLLECLLILEKSVKLRSDTTTDDLIALWDVGAYCGVLGSNYNMRPRRMELLVTGENVRIIRKEESYEDILKDFCNESFNVW